MIHDRSPLPTARFTSINSFASALAKSISFFFFFFSSSFCGGSLKPVIPQWLKEEDTCLSFSLDLVGRCFYLLLLFEDRVF